MAAQCQGLFLACNYHLALMIDFGGKKLNFIQIGLGTANFRESLKCTEIDKFVPKLKFSEIYRKRIEAVGYIYIYIYIYRFMWFS